MSQVRRRRTQPERRAESEQRLPPATAELIVERGFGQLSLSAIGERAGYSHALVNHLFGTKAALIERLNDIVDELYRDVRYSAGHGAACQAPPQPASATHGGPQVFWLLPQLHGLPQGDGGRDRRLRARRRLRDGADDRHLRHRTRHEDRHAGDPLPRPGAGQPAHVLPSLGTGAGPASAVDR
jgi:AcrR family transcriptional regulator